MFFNDFFNLVLVSKDIEPSNGRTRTRGFLSTVRVISLTTRMLSINLVTNSFQSILFKPIYFLAYFEKNGLLNRPSDFKPHHYRLYVDDIFVLFTSLEYLEAFRNFLNGQHTNISFTFENEKQNRMPFLDVKIIREDKTFTTSIYRNPTFSGVYTHFESFLPSTFKFGTV